MFERARAVEVRMVRGDGDPHRLQIQLIHDVRDQIRIGLTDSGTGVAQGDSAVDHAVQHSVTQCDLLLLFDHAIFRHQASEDVVYPVVKISSLHWYHPFCRSVFL